MPRTESGTWIRRAHGDAVRIEAFIAGRGYAPHRHDSYVFALTLDGVQSFRYRGCERHSRPGGAIVLHPDELHDGHAGTEAGFRYRALAVDPGIVQRMLGGKALPFLATGTSTDPRLLRALAPLLGDVQRALDELAYQDALFDLAHTLAGLCGGVRDMPRADYAAAELARDYLQANWDEAVALSTLERVSQRDRWKLSRDFRSAFGTSPYRYLLMRRLEHARTLLAEGTAIAEVAFTCRFADQSHLTRHFRHTFGMTPRQWLSACKR